MIEELKEFSPADVRGMDRLMRELKEQRVEPEV